MLCNLSDPCVCMVSNDGIVGTDNPGTALPGHATTANTAGAVTEIISAANNVRDSWGIWIGVTATGASVAASSANVDILIGGATDDVLISRLACGYSILFGYGRQYFFPIHIPAGVRIAAQLTSVRTGISARISVRLYGGGVPPFRVGRKVTTYGTSAIASSGQDITTTAGTTPTSWTELTASTSEDHFAAIVGMQTRGFTALVAGMDACALAIGAATEQVIGSWSYQFSTIEDICGPLPILPAFYPIPAGSRLTVGIARSVSNAPSGTSQYTALIYAIS